VLLLAAPQPRARVRRGRRQRRLGDQSGPAPRAHDGGGRFAGNDGPLLPAMTNASPGEGGVREPAGLPPRHSPRISGPHHPAPQATCAGSEDARAPLPPSVFPSYRLGRPASWVNGPQYTGTAVLTCAATISSVVELGLTPGMNFGSGQQGGDAASAPHGACRLLRVGQRKTRPSRNGSAEFAIQPPCTMATRSAAGIIGCQYDPSHVAMHECQSTQGSGCAQ
jgi:hypothetical protein